MAMNIRKIGMNWFQVSQSHIHWLVMVLAALFVYSHHQSDFLVITNPDGTKV
jgi:hypothetical protein